MADTTDVSYDPNRQLRMLANMDFMAQATAPTQTEAKPQNLSTSEQVSAITPLNAPSSLMSTIDEKLKQVNNAQDSMEAIKGLAEIRGAIAAEDSRFTKQAASAAYAEFSVPMLEATLQQNIQLDNAAPGYRAKFGMADSKQTEDVRNQLLRAKSAADASIPKRLLTNAAYTELMAKAKAVDSMAEHVNNRLRNRESDLDQKAADFYYNKSPEALKLFNEATDNEAGDPRKAMANMRDIYSHPHLKEQLSALEIGGEAALPKLVASGNPFAKRVALKREISVFGDAEVTAKKLAEVEKTGSDSADALMKFKIMKAAGSYGTGEDIKALESSYNKFLGVAAGNTKADQEKASLARADIAVKYARFSAERDFNSNIPALRHKSSIPIPDWLDAASKDPTIGKIDKTTAISLANSAPTSEGRKARLTELTKFYESAVITQNKSLLFQVNPLSVEQLKAEGAMSYANIVWKDVNKIGRAIGTVASDAASIAQFPASLLYEVGQSEPGTSLEDLNARFKKRLNIRGLDPLPVK